jgi:Flp pilus assembly protein TadD
MFARHQFSDALSEMRSVIERDPNAAWAYSQYGIILLFDGRTAEAIPQIETALRLSPRDPIRIFGSFNCAMHKHT